MIPFLAQKNFLIASQVLSPGELAWLPDSSSVRAFEAELEGDGRRLDFGGFRLYESGMIAADLDSILANAPGSKTFAGILYGADPVTIDLRDIDNLQFNDYLGDLAFTSISYLRIRNLAPAGTIELDFDPDQRLASYDDLTALSNESLAPGTTSLINLASAVNLTDDFSKIKFTPPADSLMVVSLVARGD